MANFAQAIAQTGHLTLDQQKQAGKPIAGGIDEKHVNFLKILIGLIESGTIDPYSPRTFLNDDVYAHLDEEWLEKTDLALVNIAQQVRIIHEYWVSKETPNDARQLQTMVEQLWQMKQKIEEHHDVFKF